MENDSTAEIILGVSDLSGGASKSAVEVIVDSENLGLHEAPSFQQSFRFLDADPHHVTIRCKGDLQIDLNLSLLEQLRARLLAAASSQESKAASARLFSPDVSYQVHVRCL